MTPPDPMFLYNAALMISLLASIAGNIVLVIRGNRVQKREVSFSDDFTPKRDFQAHKEVVFRKFGEVDGEFKAVRQEMGEQREEINRAGEERATKIHDRINDLPAQIVVLLKNTGVIK